MLLGVSCVYRHHFIACDFASRACAGALRPWGKLGNGWERPVGGGSSGPTRHGTPSLESLKRCPRRHVVIVVASMFVSMCFSHFLYVSMTFYVNVLNLEGIALPLCQPNQLSFLPFGRKSCPQMYLHMVQATIVLPINSSHAEKMNFQGLPASCRVTMVHTSCHHMRRETP